MLMKKIAIVAFAAAVTGCSNTSALEENITSLTNKVDALSTQVADLESQQKAISKDVSAAKEAAKSANDRIDNVVSSYKK
ncbi:LPP leucine zipper domain-containing protein [Colwellia sp. RSH04]|uniref:LPP leucine zipper domain-containing protein n=1 Tax=Colwellia sp. RSH04 TaxID=2305464 RepID=UPI00217550B8|nr:LPP leucine zipper domain-containing protein [Colwellia sp. RSH04]